MLAIAPEDSAAAASSSHTLLSTNASATNTGGSKLRIRSLRTEMPPPVYARRLMQQATTTAVRGMGGPGELQVSCEVVCGEVCRIQNWVVAQGSGGGGKAPRSQGFSRDGAHEACGRLRAGWRRLETRRMY